MAQAFCLRGLSLNPGLNFCLFSAEIVTQFLLGTSLFLKDSVRESFNFDNFSIVTKNVASLSNKNPRGLESSIHKKFSVKVDN